MYKIEFFMPGEPQSKQRPVHTKGRGIYTPSATKDYESEIAMQYIANYYDLSYKETPLEVEVYAGFSDEKVLAYVSKKDLDNIVKIVLDGLNKVAYDDDRWIIKIKAQKFHAKNPGVFVRIKESENYFIPKDLLKHFY